MPSIRDRIRAYLEKRLYDGIMVSLDYVIRERRKHYSLGKGKTPHEKDITRLILGYSRYNCAISAGINLLSGPLGIIVVVPETILVLRNQLRLIYDIATAHGKADMMDRELLAVAFLMCVGQGAPDMVRFKDGRVLVGDISLKVLSRMAWLIAAKLLQRLLKSVLSKLIPGIGTVLIMYWSYISTKRIGLQADVLFRQKLTHLPED